MTCTKRLTPPKLEDGRLICEVCDSGGDDAHFDEQVREKVFEVYYGVPLGKASEQVETKLEDLSVLCANCHRAIHGYREAQTGPEMRNMPRDN